MNESNSTKIKLLNLDSKEFKDRESINLEPNLNYSIKISNIPHSYNLSIYIPKNSSLKIINNSEADIKLKFDIYLIEENAEFKYSNQSSYSNAKVDNDIKVFHQASNTSSFVNIKGIIDGNSQISGKVVLNINPEANNCTAKQKIEFINLSKLSKIDFTPILEIENSSSISEHSFSIVNLSAQELFYFMSRGIERKIAKQLILNGFLSDNN